MRATGGYRGSHTTNLFMDNIGRISKQRLGNKTHSASMINRALNKLSRIQIYHPKPVPPWFWVTIDKLRLNGDDLSLIQVAFELRELQTKIITYCECEIEGDLS